ncbi:MAG: NYN domain-containing protein [Rubrobacteraceae bacterium]|uniref:NYN domain-containing protein n=1 Tax=Rubrobacter naiadicus TaxID=1392641 RepID=UPI002361A1BA|nr:NYN domain-containing protein [Rubrobacter naiadicus]MBX6762485.1 NYN domain-containing protein [Rubrobacteraceae bacterium]MCL6437859.1 NYN domain-containing protein [Rubrobacteraceae bacterium]
MARYLILDGYNLIAALDRYRRGREEAGLEERRDLLVNDALKAAGWTDRVVIVVFDAHGTPEPRREETLAGGAVRVIYSSAGETADDVIERLIETLDGPATVFTADFALQRTALIRGATRATPREFQALLDELPALARSPRRGRRMRLSDRLSAETLRSLEEVRRRELREG